MLCKARKASSPCFRMFSLARTTPLSTVRFLEMPGQVCVSRDVAVLRTLDKFVYDLLDTFPDTTTDLTWTEDRATQRCDPSAGPGAKTGVRAELRRSVPLLSCPLRDWPPSDKPSRHDAATLRTRCPAPLPDARRSHAATRCQGATRRWHTPAPHCTTARTSSKRGPIPLSTARGLVPLAPRNWYRSKPLLTANREPALLNRRIVRHGGISRSV